MRGTLLPEDAWAVGLVGTRRVTAYGRAITEQLSRELAQQHITVVSGLARGVDTIAHMATLDAGGRTVAVLGCGPDLVYPPENAKLAARIIEQGALVTEFAPGTQPELGNFPARNRLISGLSLAVLVTEAPADSGALITARFAGEQGRDVFAVPGNINSRASTGANRLIQDGAKRVLGIGDVLSELNLHLVPPPDEGDDLFQAAPAEQLALSLGAPQPENETEAQVLGGLSRDGQPRHIDELCRALGLPVATVSGTLVLLELRGMVRLTGPMTYAREG